MILKISTKKIPNCHSEEKEKDIENLFYNEIAKKAYKLVDTARSELITLNERTKLFINNLEYFK